MRPDDDLGYRRNRDVHDAPDRGLLLGVGRRHVADRRLDSAPKASDLVERLLPFQPSVADEAQDWLRRQ
jgi:hypothetical protein